MLPMIVKKSSDNKKAIFLIIMILVICVISTPIFTDKIYLGDDSLFHYHRIKELANSFRNGVFYPTLYSNSLGGQGYASALFYPDIALFIPALLHLGGISVYNALSIYIFLLNILTIVLAYYAIRKFLEDILEIGNKNKCALLGATAYMIYPYRLHNMVVRGAVSEMIAMSIIPIIVLAFYKIFVRKEYRYWKLLSFGFSAILLAHLGSTLIMGILGVVFLLTNLKVLKDVGFYKSIAKAILLSMLTTAYFLVPMLEQMNSGSFMYSLLPTIDDISLNPNSTIDKQAFKVIASGVNQYLLLTLNILFVYMSIRILKFLRYSKELGKDLILIISSLLVLIYICLMTTNLFPWTIIKRLFPLIQQIQFPFRFFMLGGIPFSLFVCLSWNSFGTANFKVKIVQYFILMLIPLSIVNIFGLRERLSFSESQIEEDSFVSAGWTLGFGEYLPDNLKNTKYQFVLKKAVNDEDTITSTINVDGYSAQIKSKKQFNKLEVDLVGVKIGEDILDYSLETKLIYYKGYKAYADDEEVQVSLGQNGRILVSGIPKDTKKVTIEYTGTKVQKFSRITTALTLISIPLYLLFKKDDVF